MRAASLKSPPQTVSGLMTVGHVQDDATTGSGWCSRRDKASTVGWIIERLPHLIRSTIRMAEAELRKIEGTYKALDCPNRIVRPDIVLNPRAEAVCLVPGLSPVLNARFVISRIVRQLLKKRVLAQPRPPNRNRYNGDQQYASKRLRAGCRQEKPAA